MNWNISAWSIRRPVPSLVLFMVLIALGCVSSAELPITRFPTSTSRSCRCASTSRAPRLPELEVQVTKKIEDAIAGVNGRQAPDLHGHRGLLADRHRVPPRGEPGPRAQRR